MPALDYPGAAKRAEVTADFASGALSISIDAATNWPDGASGKFVVVVDPLEATAEKILIASRTGTVLTVDAAGRGWDGTSASSHATGAVIYPVFDADSAQRHEDHIFDTADAHDASAISYAGGSGMTATDVEGALDELAGDVVALDTRVDTLEGSGLTTASIAAALSEADLIATAETVANDGAFHSFPTVGPTVTLTTGSLVWVEISAEVYNINPGAAFVYAGVNVTGASAVSALVAKALTVGPTLYAESRYVGFRLTVTPGANIFEMQGMQNGSNGPTWAYRNMRITRLN